MRDSLPTIASTDADPFVSNGVEETATIRFFVCLGSFGAEFLFLFLSEDLSRLEMSDSVEPPGASRTLESFSTTH